MEEKVSRETGWAGVEKWVQGEIRSLVMAAHTQPRPRKDVCRVSITGLAGRAWGPGLPKE